MFLWYIVLKKLSSEFTWWVSFVRLFIDVAEEYKKMDTLGEPMKKYRLIK